MRSPLIKSTVAALAILAGSWTSAHAQIVYWSATSGGNPATAAGGSWDNLATNWSTSPTGGALNATAWNSDSAKFVGTGGTITLGDAISFNQIDFAGSTGSYTIDTSGGSLFAGGAGVLNGTGHQFTGSGTFQFGGSASSGAANFVNYSGDLHFGAPGSGDTANAGTSTMGISAAGSATFSAHSTGPVATITNAGSLTFEESATAPGTTINNTGNVDISGITPATGITMKSLTNGAGANLDLQSKTLSLGAGSGNNSLVLADGNTLNFKLNSTTDHGQINVTNGTFMGNPGTNGGGTAIDVGAGPGTLHGGEYVLIDFTAANTITSVDLGDFTLGTLPLSLTGSVLKFDGNNLVLAVVPEPSTFAMPLAALVAMGWMRRRRAGATEATAMA